MAKMKAARAKRPAKAPKTKRAARAAKPARGARKARRAAPKKAARTARGRAAAKKAATRAQRKSAAGSARKAAPRRRPAARPAAKRKAGRPARSPRAAKAVRAPVRPAAKAAVPAAKAPDRAAERAIRWWRESRYGLFIHWGLYSVLAGEWKGWQTPNIGEWIMHDGKIPVAEYEKIAGQFNPVRFDAREWVRLAKDAGMRYVTITAKHHDGFAMYHSRCSRYNIVDATPFGRDPMADLAEACREAGLKLCFYYSQVQDWHEKDAVGNTWDWPDESSKDYRRYFEAKCKPQVRELLTQYGDIGMIWFDTPLNVELKYSQELYRFVKAIQPSCLVNGRIGNQCGDYINTGDNLIPSLPLDRDWEIPATLNDTWGYKSFDHNWKSAEKVARLLVTINGRGGNYLLNVGPTAEGVIPEPSARILREVGRWVTANGEAVYGTRPAPVLPYDPSSWGGVTFKPGRLFLHVFDWPHRLTIHGLANTVKAVRLLADASAALNWRTVFNKSQKQHRLVIDRPDRMPDTIATVVEVQLGEEQVKLDSLLML
jgi:alpha-L-fucosidase